MAGSYSVRVRGPMFDGLAINAMQDYTRAVEEELAHQAQQEIQRRARRMNRSGRNTGTAARHVRVFERGSAFWVHGDSNKGEVWWPWLEGTSKRNFTTRFKGYHTFRVVKNLVQRQSKKRAQEILARYIPEMGGRV
jgi:hypothetical protein